MNVIRTLRNHWKKSVIITGVAAYGINYGRRKYHESLVLRAYCLEAKKYGTAVVKSTGDRPRKVTVFLNPAAHKGKAKSLFEKNVAPLLHLAGIEVNLVLTEYEGQAKKYMDVIEDIDAIVVAGGNGTLSEVVTGLLRRADQEQFSKTPLGFIPLGYTNTMAKLLCPSVASDSVLMNEMTMSIIRGNMKSADVIQIKGDDDKSVYAVYGVDWGSYSDTDIRKKNYWYFGSLRDYFSLVISTIRYWPATVEAFVSHVNPCAGCSTCYVPPPVVQWKWWHLLISPKREAAGKDYSNVINEECGQVHEQDIVATQVSLRTNNCLKSNNQLNKDEAHSMKLSITAGNMSRSEYIRYGQLKNKALDDSQGEKEQPEELNKVEQTFQVREFTLKPKALQNEDGSIVSGRAGAQWLLIDREQFELKAATCSLLPKKLHFYFSDSFTVPLNRATGRLINTPT